MLILGCDECDPAVSLLQVTRRARGAVMVWCGVVGERGRGTSGYYTSYQLDDGG